MAGPWEKYQQGDQQGPWSSYAQDAPSPAPEQPPKDVYHGRILPLTREGNQVRWDWNAGITGPLLRAFTLPHDVTTGKIDPKSDEGIARALEMATVVNPAPAAMRAGEGILGAPVSPKKAPVPVPTQSDLKDAASAGYRTMREMGVDYAPDAVSMMTGGIGQKLAEKGFTDRTAPKTVSLLGELANAPKPRPGESVAVPLNGLDAARQQLGVIAGGGDSDAAAAQMAKRLLDEFVSAPPEGSVLAGPASSAAKALTDARGNYAAGMRSEDLTGIGGAAELRAAAANSGQNLGNSIRSRVASALLGDKLKGYTPEEIAAAKSIVEGTMAQNTLRDAGNVMGGGGGLGALASGSVGATVGSALAGPPGAAVGAAAVPLAGRLAKALSNKLTEKDLARLDELTRKRSPLYESLLEAAPMVPGQRPDAREALMRALLMSRSPVGAYETGGGF